MYCKQRLDVCISVNLSPCLMAVTKELLQYKTHEICRMDNHKLGTTCKFRMRYCKQNTNMAQVRNFVNLFYKFNSSLIIKF